MKIRNKILVYFSTTVITLTAISLAIIHLLFYEYREEEFQQQQKEKAEYTIKMLSEYKELSENLADIMDELTIHDFYDEKMLVFDENKKLLFSSIDDLPIENYNEILDNISAETNWYETKQGDYDIVAIFTSYHQKNYYAISKAYDAFGYTKMFFLRNVLIGIFLFIAVVVILLSQYLSSKITKPITALAEKLNRYDLSSENTKELEISTSSYELKQLTERFNELLRRTNEAFAFQKHTIHHISHQLKTPIAILVSELEKINESSSLEEIKPKITHQAIKAKSLGNIINVLLEISKIESGQAIHRQLVRIDEMLFDVIEELNIIYPDFQFEVNYVQDEIDEERLILSINPLLMRQAFQNLLANCVAYSKPPKAEVKLDCSDRDKLKIQIINIGLPISMEEEKYLFEHFFRGQNSEGKSGFGLGLVLTKKILELNKASICYSNPEKNLNVFEVVFPLGHQQSAPELS